MKNLGKGLEKFLNNLTKILRTFISEIIVRKIIKIFEKSYKIVEFKRNFSKNLQKYYLEKFCSCNLGETYQIQGKHSGNFENISPKMDASQHPQ